MCAALSDSGDNAPWEPIYGESKKPYELFKTFLHLGPGRSLDAVARVHDIKIVSLKNYSSKFKWAPRAAAYDIAQAEATREAIATVVAPAVGDLTLEHLNVLGIARRLGLQRLQDIVSNDGKELRARDAIYLLLETIRLEREIMAVGPAIKNVEEHLGIIGDTIRATDLDELDSVVGRIIDRAADKCGVC